MALEIEAKLRANDEGMGCSYKEQASELIKLLRSDKVVKLEDLNRALINC